MNIYCLSLKKATERRAQMEEYFGDQLVYLDAVDGAEYSDESGELWDESKRAELVSSGVLDSSSRLYPAQVACNLSHIAAVEKFLATDDEICAVLEDDVVPTEFLQRNLDNGKKMEELIKIQSNCDMWFLCDAFTSRGLVKVDADGQIKSSRTFMGYALTRHGAEVYLQVALPMIWLLDHQFSASCFPKHKYYRKALPERLMDMPSVVAKAPVCEGLVKLSELAVRSYLIHGDRARGSSRGRETFRVRRELNRKKAELLREKRIKRLEGSADEGTVK